MRRRSLRSVCRPDSAQNVQLIPVSQPFTSKWIGRDFTLTSVDGRPGLGLQAHVVQVLVERLFWWILDDGGVHALCSLLGWRVGRPHGSFTEERLILMAFQGRDI